MEKTDIITPVSDVKSTPNFEEEFVNYLRYERNMSPDTIRAYEKDLYQFLRCFRKREPAKTNPAEIGRASTRERE